ncbi:glycosyltransferase family 2 protein [Laspinema sp. D1]|uniref:Glycosyltransferase family 2 protein n=1 Tax=Laspinema palackyanum D2a TaxID=2953684 RepID=A0ABT2MMJ9_9CYAN|nr:glycosyltransferase family 2 protein [Laspinema sp. D2a]
MKPPAISVIIPTLNRLPLLQQTLESLRQQTFTQWEALVVDDGSNDGTVEFLQRVSQEDSRIRYLERESSTSGAPARRNQGTAASEGKYVIYLDSDDLLAPTALSNRFQAMENNPELDFGVFSTVLFRNHPGDMRLLLNKETTTQQDDINRFLKIDCPWQGLCMIWKRPSFDKLGSWDEDLLSFQDWDLPMRALILQFNYKRFSTADCFWRVSQHQSIGSTSKSPAHLKSHERLFDLTHHRLMNAGLLTNERLILMGGLSFWLAQCWVESGDRSEALRVWRSSYDKNWVQQPFYSQGAWYLNQIAGGEPLISRIIYKFFELTWPKGLAFKWSKTFCNTPVPKSIQLPTVPLPLTGTQ